MSKKPLRNQAKVITEKDGTKNVNDDYAVELDGKKYPLMSAKMTGFINGQNKNGKTRKKQIMNMSESEKKEYIEKCKSIFDLDSDVSKAVVGDTPNAVKPITKEIKYKAQSLGIQPAKIDIKTEMPESVEYQVNSTKEKIQPNPSDTSSDPSEPSNPSNPSNPNPSNPQNPNTSKGNSKKGQTLSELKPINATSVNQGLDAQLQQDDGKADESQFYQFLINKYFSILDFTRVLAYVKTKNKNVEKMTPDKIISFSKDIAQELGTSLKYMNNDIKILRRQLYELLALQIGKSKQEPEATDKNNIGLIVDFDSVFGPDYVLNKDKFKQEFMNSKSGDVPNVMQSVIPPSTSEYKNTAVPTAVGSSKNEGAYSGPDENTAHRNFNLADSVLKYDSSFSQQFAKKINEIPDEFSLTNIFRFRKDDSEFNRQFKKLL